MFEFFSAVLDTMIGWEGLAALLSVAYVYLAGKESQWCWPAAFTSTAIYTALFYGVNLQLDSLLQLYYMSMAVYGWWQWRRGFKAIPLAVSEWTLGRHVTAVAILLVPAFLLAEFGIGVLGTDYAYLDALTSVYAVFATYLIAKKILAGWIYFAVIDIISIYLYIIKGLDVTAGLFVVYTVFCFVNYRLWRREWTAGKIGAAT